MANQEQLDVIRQGSDVWNAWREAHSGVIIDLRRANLFRTNLSGTNLSRADLDQANLSLANLSGADLSTASLSEASLRRANLRRANLRGTNLSGTDLSRTDLSNTDLGRANLSGAILDQTKFHHATAWYTLFADLDLRQAEGLEIMNHIGPSTIGADTLLRSEGNIPEVFLKGAGLIDTFITYVRSLVQQPIQYYTCFISYSSKDQAFAERLYADLQSKGVRCWFAPEDLKIGERFRVRIDESIKLYDKLVLVLSEHSIASKWVETEIEAAFEKEHRKGTLTLFPVKLDESVMETGQAWAADIRRTRHIGDFTKWKEHDAYQRSFQRVLRDLNTITPIEKP